MLSQKIVVERAGGPGSLKLVDCSIPQPHSGTLRIRVEAAGVAFADVMIREGRYPGVSLPATPGYDVVGTVEMVGDGVDRSWIGRRVGALTVTGGYARHIIVPADQVTPVPDGLASRTAVALILNYVTAWQMLTRNTSAGEGDVVLVHGGAGGVGTALLEICRLRGVRALATVSSGKRKLVETLGGEPIDYQAEDFVLRCEELTNGLGVDAAFDHLSGAHAMRSFRALRATGTLVCYGALSIFPGGRSTLMTAARTLWREPRFTPLRLLRVNRAVVGFDIAGRRAARPDWFAADLEAIFRLADAGSLKPVLDGVLPLELAAEAHRRLGASESRGKIVLDCR